MKRQIGTILTLKNQQVSVVLRAITIGDAWLSSTFCLASTFTQTLLYCFAKRGLPAGNGVVWGMFLWYFGFTMSQGGIPRD